MNVNEELLQIQNNYKESQDIRVLGTMLRADLLPHIAEVHLKLLLAKLKRHYDNEAIYNMVIDCSLKVIEHLEKGNYVKSSFTMKMKSIVSNYLRKLDRDNKRQVATDLTLDCNSDWGDI